MQKQLWQYPSSDGRTTIFADVCLPQGEPRGVVQLCHGMCEHMGRYADFAAFLAEHGFIAAGNDHLGHGRSVVSKADLGFFAARNGWRMVLDDTHELTRRLQKTFPGLPIVLFGHSMGSAIARCTVAAHTADYAGAIFCGTPVQSAAGAGKLVISLIAAFKGPRAHSRLLDKLSLGAYNKRFAGEGRPNAWLTRRTEVCDAYNADPLCGFSFTTSAYRDLITMVGAAQHRRWPASLPADFPVLVISGQDDPCGGFGKGVTKVYGHMTRRGMTRTHLRLYPGARHELLNELCADEVYDQLLGWCSAVS